MSPRIRLTLLLAVAGGIGAAAVVPYQAALVPEIAASPVPLWALALLAGVQNTVLLGVLSWLGLRAGDALGLGAPVLEGRESAPALRYVTLAALGIVAGLAIAVVDGSLLMPRIPEPRTEIPSPSPLVALGASLYGAIAEELLLRLFALTGLAWILSRLRVPPRVAIPTALIGAAVLFGVGHLPTAASIWPLTPLVVARIIGLNLVFGLGFGALYVRWGLLAAMCAHFGADIGLHVLFPILS